MTILQPSLLLNQPELMSTNTSSWAEKLIVMDTGRSFKNSFTAAHAKGKFVKIVSSLKFQF